LLRICFIVSEIFAFKRLGGYGKLVRMLGNCLARRDVEVFAITWRDPGQSAVEHIDGITVLSFPYNYRNGSSLSHIPSYLQAQPLYRIADADIYHSIEASVETYLAERMMPNRKHIIHFQDPYDEKAYREMSTVDPAYDWSTRKKLQFYSTITLLRKACQRADKLCTQAKCFIPRVRRLYNLDNDEIDFLPNPVEIPQQKIEKAPKPTVCFLGRWDPQKRVHMFLELAKRFSEVNFIALGKGHNEEADRALRAKYRNIPNLKMLGFVSEAEKSRILSGSWIMVNTSIREGLPISFLEAIAHKTAIISHVNPDNFSTRFGYYAKNGDFESGLKYLLQNDLWEKKGREGYAYVSKVHDAHRVIDQYIAVYKNLLEQQ